MSARPVQASCSALANAECPDDNTVSAPFSISSHHGEHNDDEDEDESDIESTVVLEEQCLSPMFHGPSVTHRVGCLASFQRLQHDILLSSPKAHCCVDVLTPRTPPVGTTCRSLSGHPTAITTTNIATINTAATSTADVMDKESAKDDDPTTVTTSHALSSDRGTTVSTLLSRPDYRVALSDNEVQAPFPILPEISDHGGASPRDELKLLRDADISVRPPSHLHHRRTDTLKSSGKSDTSNTTTVKTTTSSYGHSHRQQQQHHPQHHRRQSATTIHSSAFSSSGSIPAPPSVITTAVASKSRSQSRPLLVESGSVETTGSSSGDGGGGATSSATPPATNTSGGGDVTSTMPVPTAPAAGLASFGLRSILATSSSLLSHPFTPFDCGGVGGGSGSLGLTGAPQPGSRSSSAATRRESVHMTEDGKLVMVGPRLPSWRSGMRSPTGGRSVKVSSPVSRSRMLASSMSGNVGSDREGSSTSHHHGVSGTSGPFSSSVSSKGTTPTKSSAASPRNLRTSLRFAASTSTGTTSTTTAVAAAATDQDARNTRVNGCENSSSNLSYSSFFSKSYESVRNFFDTSPNTAHPPEGGGAYDGDTTHNGGMRSWNDGGSGSTSVTLPHSTDGSHRDRSTKKLEPLKACKIASSLPTLMPLRSSPAISGQEEGGNISVSGLVTPMRRSFRSVLSECETSCTAHHQQHHVRNKSPHSFNSTLADLKGGVPPNVMDISPGGIKRSLSYAATKSMVKPLSQRTWTSCKDIRAHSAGNGAGAETVAIAVGGGRRRSSIVRKQGGGIQSTSVNGYGSSPESNGALASEPFHLIDVPTYDGSLCMPPCTSPTLTINSDVPASSTDVSELSSIPGAQNSSSEPGNHFGLLPGTTTPVRRAPPHFVSLANRKTPSPPLTAPPSTLYHSIQRHGEEVVLPPSGRPVPHPPSVPITIDLSMQAPAETQPQKVCHEEELALQNGSGNLRGSLSTTRPSQPPPLPSSINTLQLPSAGRGVLLAVVMDSHPSNSPREHSRTATPVPHSAFEDAITSFMEGRAEVRGEFCGQEKEESVANVDGDGVSEQRKLASISASSFLVPPQHHRHTWEYRESGEIESLPSLTPAPPPPPPITSQPHALVERDSSDDTSSGCMFSGSCLPPSHLASITTNPESTNNR